MKEDLFESASIPKAYFTLALPVVLSMVITLVYNMVDTYFIALTHDTNIVAGVSLCAPLFMLMIAFGDIFGLGGSSVVSRLFGQKKDDQAKRVSAFSMCSSIIFGLCVTVIMFIFTKPILNLLGSDSHTYQYAFDYYKYLALGAPAIIFAIVPTNLLRSEALAKEAMIGTISGSIVNIILDPLFIFTLGMGAGGAALATVLGNVVSCVILAFYVLKKSKKLSLNFKDAKVSTDIVRAILFIGIPASLTNIMQSFSTALLNNNLVAYGNEKVAAMGIALKVNMIIMLVMVGFAFGAQPLLGYNYGAKKFNRLKKIIKFDILVEVVFSCVVGLMILITAPSIIGLFMKDSSIVNSGAQMLRFLTLSTPLVGVILVFTTLFQAFGKATEALILSISRQGVLFAICIIVLTNVMGYTGIISSQPIADVLTLIISVILYLRIRKSSLQ